MQFSIATIIAALATIHTVNASWEITAFNTNGCVLNGASPNDFYRVIKSDQSVPDCFTFGQDMPGTSCTETFLPDTTAAPCIDRDLIPKSVEARGNCVFYGEANCGGTEVGISLPGAENPTCVDTGSDVLSYKCWSE